MVKILNTQNLQFLPLRRRRTFPSSLTNEIPLSPFPNLGGAKPGMRSKVVPSSESQNQTFPFQRLETLKTFEKLIYGQKSFFHGGVDFESVVHSPQSTVYSLQSIVSTLCGLMPLAQCSWRSADRPFRRLFRLISRVMIRFFGLYCVRSMKGVTALRNKAKKNRKTTNRHQNAVEYIAGKSFLFISFTKK